MASHFDVLIDFKDNVDFGELMHNGESIKEYLIDLTKRSRCLKFPFMTENLANRLSLSDKEYDRFLASFYLTSRLSLEKPILSPYPTTAIEDLDSVAIVDNQGHKILPTLGKDQFYLTSCSYRPYFHEGKDHPSISVMMGLVNLKIKTEEYPAAYSMGILPLYHYMQLGERRLLPDKENPEYSSFIKGAIVNESLAFFKQCAYYNLIFELIERNSLN